MNKGVLLTVCCAGLAPGAFALHYKVYDIGALQRTSIAFGVNGADLVVGRSKLTGGPCGWTLQRGIFRLSFMPWASMPGSMEKVNDSGLACGTVYWLVSGQLRQDQPCVWSEKTGFRLVPVPQGSDMGYCNDINEGGTVAGVMVGGPVNERPFVWDGGSQVDLLDHPPGWKNGVARGINNSAMVVGIAMSPTGYPHAFVWSKATGMQDLGLLDGYYQSDAFSINDSSQVVGTCYSNVYGLRGYVTTPGGPMKPLDGFLGELLMPYKINNRGLIVGIGIGFQGQFAAVYDPLLGLVDLNRAVQGGPSGLNLVSAYDVNEQGDIVGLANLSGTLHGFFAKRLD